MQGELARQSAAIASGARNAAAVRSAIAVGKQRNVAVATLNLSKDLKGNLVSVSGQNPRGTGVLAAVAQNALKAANPCRNKGLADAERNIFENLYNLLPKGVRGRITMFTERPPCPACLGAAREFMNHFPGVTVEFFHNASKPVLNWLSAAIPGAFGGAHNLAPRNVRMKITNEATGEIMQDSYY